MNRLVKGLATIAVLAVLAPSAATAQMGDAPASHKATITGTVIDLDCKFRLGMSGEGHRMCAQVCGDNNLPLAILGDDGKLYMPVGGGMPGDAQNPRLREFAEQEVVIEGNVFEAGGAMALEIESIKQS